jgi:hypothetical protein
VESKGNVETAMENALGRRSTGRLRGRLFGRTHLLPDFIIIGASRGGAARLLHRLELHPNVIEGPGETRFFDTHRHTYGIGWYRMCFPRNSVRRSAYRAGLHPVFVGEASPTYLSHPNVPARVARGVPQVKLLVLLRDPTGRAVSDWAWRRDQGLEIRPFKDVVEAEIGPPGGGDTIRVPIDKQVDDPLIVRRGIYQPQLERWRTHFPDDQLMVVLSQRWLREPGIVANEVCEFLEIPRVGGATPGPQERPPNTDIDAETLARLRAFYAPYDAELAEYLDLDLGWDG